MVFQKPNPFPKSIYENVAYGPRIHGLTWSRTSSTRSVETVAEAAPASGRRSKDRLERSGTAPSGGQQQRLCIARTIAVDPEVILMDEPCSALDPIATARIEELIHELQGTLRDRDRHAQHAAGGARFAAHGLLPPRRDGRIRQDQRDVHGNPREQRTQDYITGALRHRSAARMQQQSGHTINGVR